MPANTTTGSSIIYLDHAATSPCDPEVADVVRRMSADTSLGNAASFHAAGRRAAGLVDAAAANVAALLGCEPAEIVFTSGATEANNIAILGTAAYRERHGRHFVTARTEHRAVADVFRALERRGADVTWLTPCADGRIAPDDVAGALRDDTQLVSIMWVNNETGIVNDIAAIGVHCRERNVALHVDAAQAAGKLPVDLSALPVDLMSISGHKIHGPPGCGALYVANRPGVHPEPLFYGGGQQRGRRPGTLATPLVAGLGTAAQLAATQLDATMARNARLRDRLWTALAAIDGLRLNSPPDVSLPSILNVSAADVDGEALLLALEPLCVSTGSACNSQQGEPSAVLRASGRSDAEAQGAIRFSFGRTTTDADVDAAGQIYRSALARLRAIAPAA